MTNLPLAQQTSTVTQSIIRAKDLKDANRAIFWLVVLGFFAFPANPATALVGVPLLGISILQRRSLMKDDSQQAM
jgi:hypothetical protein